MRRRSIALTLGLLVCSPLAPPAAAEGAPPPITEAEAHAIGVEAYVYFYSLVTMDVTRKQFTNIEPGKELGKGPMNMFNNVPEYPPADFKGVVRPNFDTLYSIAYLDMTKEPVIVSAPDTNGRYYLLPMLDMWLDVFASPGWRTTGTQAANFLVTPPGWRPDLRDRFFDEFKLPKDIQRIDAPTPYVWIIGRTKTDGPPDYDAVHKIQAGFKVTLLSEWGKSAKPIEVKIDPSVDMKTPPKIQVDTMPAGKYFAYAAELLRVNPPHLTDEPIVARMKRIGIEPGRSFDIEKAIYPLNLGDETGRPLDGANKYVLHFDKDVAPPVNAFWSVTLYDPEGFQVANSLNRFAVSSWMPFNYSPDGSLDIYFQNESPGKDKEANWLPASKGAFNLTMPLYGPKSEALTGRWNPPPITRVQGLPSLTTQ